MAINSRQDLADYALRELGAPVLNIEIDDEQLEDALTTAITFFQEYHPDGTVRDVVKHKVTGTVITLDSVAGLAEKMVISSADGKTTTHAITISGLNVTIAKMRGEIPFAVNDTINFNGNTATITAITLGDVDNEYLPMDEGIWGITNVIPFRGYTEGLFDLTYQLRMNDLRNLYSGSMAYFQMSMSYLQMLDFMLRKEKQFRFNRYMNKIFLDINWADDITVGDYLVIEVQRTLDADTYTSVLNNIWMKKLVSAYVKRYWGANLRKYNGVQLLGGVTLDGERIYGEAVNEIAAIEQEIMQNQAPLEWFMG